MVAEGNECKVMSPARHVSVPRLATCACLACPVRFGFLRCSSHSHKTTREPPRAAAARLLRTSAVVHSLLQSGKLQRRKCSWANIPMQSLLR